MSNIYCRAICMFGIWTISLPVRIAIYLYDAIRYNQPISHWWRRVKNTENMYSLIFKWGIQGEVDKIEELREYLRNERES